MNDFAPTPRVPVGETFAERVTFDEASIRQFAATVRDFNPIHHDAEIARRGPYGTIIASGVHPTALMMAATATHFSRRFQPLGLEFSFRFVRAVPAGARLELRWTVVDVVGKASLRGDIVTLEGAARDDAGTLYTAGTAKLLIRPALAVAGAAGGFMQPIDFYFDFSSPYGYLAARRIEALAAKHGRDVVWHPILLGIVFKSTGAAPLTEIPLKGAYAKRDMARSARFHGIADFRIPSRFPIPTQAAARIVLALRERDAALAARVAQALYRAYFADDVDISDPATAARIAGEAGADEQAMRAAVDDPAIKDALRREVDAAIALGVCGSPFVVIDGEPFWGLDRFDQIDRWLATGGF